MKFIADLHIHSHYSLATSKNLIPEQLDYWARLKGIKVVGTGDFTHPGWLKELKAKLQPAQEGLYKLKDNLKLKTLIPQYLNNPQAEVNFILTAEISNIYKKKDKVRKVHNIILAPSLEIVEKIQQKLTSLGCNITSDGRPILGMDSRDLFELLLNICDKNILIPAHIWTPWFSVLGARSGFNSIKDCYEDLTSHIFAVETGLSSDPAMNWMCSDLDKYTIISNSDAHSPEKLGREANIFNTELSYSGIINTLKKPNQKNFLSTIEFFPQEGKYHYAGHRKCNICWDPLESLKHNNICSVCGKPITLGVIERILELSDREELSQRPNPIPFYSLIPLKEILSEIYDVSPNSKEVDGVYQNIVNNLAPELEILIDFSTDKLAKAGHKILAQAIERMRNKEVYIQEGFDGEYGQIKVFSPKEKKSLNQDGLLFNQQDIKNKPTKRGIINFNLKEYQLLVHNKPKIAGIISQSPNLEKATLKDLNNQQQQALEHSTGPALIIAGPGTGKTRTLTLRIANLIKDKAVLPENILAVTFTNKAKEEMQQRLNLIFNDPSITNKINIFTFHSLGLSILKDCYKKTSRQKDFSLIDEDKKLLILEELSLKKDQSRLITQIKQNLNPCTDSDVVKYEEFLISHNLFDLDDLIYQPVKLFTNYPDILAKYQNQYPWLLVDEYQDINFAQYHMIRLLMPNTNSNLYVIGDANQAIYSFRGADVSFIRRFISDYPQASLYKLTQSYRCSQYILKASEQIIPASNLGQESLKGLNKGIKTKIIANSSDKSEAEFIARTIEELIGGLGFFSLDSKVSHGRHDEKIKSLSDFAVLCRLSRQMEVIKKAFNDHSIPYQVIGEVAFFKLKPIKPIIDLVSLLINPHLDFLKDKLIDKKILNSQTIINLKKEIKNQSISQVIKQITQTLFSKDMDSNLFKSLIELTDNFGHNWDNFLEFINLGTGVDTYQPNLETVTLSTLHGTKGLEFACVFITGCEEGLIPYSLFKDQAADPEEEKRLLYVGMTRAKSLLFLTHAKKRFIFGREYNLDRSNFLDKIEEELIEQAQSQSNKKIKIDNQQRLF